MIQRAVESIRNRESTTPRTILGFLLGMYGVFITASATVVLGMAASNYEGLIPWVLAFAAVFTVGLVVAVITIAWKDPSRLMLGQVTATEYAAIKRLHLGDDRMGEREAVIAPDPMRGTVSREDESPAHSAGDPQPRPLSTARRARAGHDADHEESDD